MKYFVCSDIHGFYDEWQKALREKGFDLNNPNHKLIICGDLFDRGDKPKQIIDYILNNKSKIILIRGNHEDLMQEMIYRNKYSVIDVINGTIRTVISLCPKWKVTQFDLRKIAKETRLQEVLDMCTNYFETQKYVFVHAWIPITSNYTYDKNWRNADPKIWEEARWLNPVDMFKYKIYEPNKIIVCGHVHCSELWHEAYPNKYEQFGKHANFEPFITKNMIALDSFPAYTHKINVVVLNEPD